MQGYIKRNSERIILEDLNHFPAVALLGPRQSGKSTLALNLRDKIPHFLYLDLESFTDLRKLEDPELFFEANTDRLVCLDEIQNRPDLFPVLRSILDRNQRNGQVLILGSASRDLIKQSSETLAGRIVYLELTPFLESEINQGDKNSLQKLWIRGGFPPSFLAEDDKISMKWRQNFIRTYMERDIPQLGFNIPVNRLGRLWMMCAHLHAQVLNYSKLGESLSLSYHTIQTHIELLEQTFMVRILPSYQKNLKKRLIKSPKIFIRDSGILHSLLDITSYNDLLGHPVLGASWEGFVLENICSELPEWKKYFFRTSSKAEIDLILEKGQNKIAVEFKASKAPVLTKGFWNALDLLNIEKAWIIAPVNDSYPIRENVIISPLHEFIKYLKNATNL